ncbi:MAG: tRNA (adenosine(37)-N6)-threonylcarbamoyltransferase complex dimerization subunit type 1 TsaB, partial [Rhodospirillales bacterium]|nr:tRNA (adenosine(37)-N6)-threonylcarbamoyltransferase complex dimerization subunit type 1 TsaB [Rhodospirillales bacterium]
MQILGFDTATSTCSAAIWRDGKICAHRFEVMERGQAEALVPMIEEVMGIGGVEYSELDAIAVTIGPGAFTGLRIGLATARALSLAASRPLIGITTFEAVYGGLGEECRRTGNLVIAMETKRADVYAQAFGEGGQNPSDPAAMDPIELISLIDSARPVQIAGDAREKAREALAGVGAEAIILSGPHQPDAGLVAAIAAGKWSTEKDALIKQS